MYQGAANEVMASAGPMWPSGVRQFIADNMAWVRVGSSSGGGGGALTLRLRAR